MMKKTICLLFVLALIAQICAIPTDTDEGNDVKDAEGHASAAANEAKKGASELEEKATHSKNDKIHAGSQNEGNTGHKKDDNAGHQNEGNEGHKKEGNAGHKKEGNAGHQNGGNAGHQGTKRGGEGLGLASKVIESSEAITKEFADKGANLVKDILGLWKM